MKLPILFSLLLAAALSATAQNAAVPSPAPTRIPAQPALTSSQTAQPKPSQATAPSAPAQPGQSAQQPGFTITTQVNEVDLTFTVTDHHGHFVNDLHQADFALLDDGKAPAQVFRFEQNTNLPLRVGMVVDTSTSIRTRFTFEQQAANEFLLAVLRPKSDKAFVEGFDLAPDFKQDWTNNLDALTTGINKLHSGGGTALFDALYQGCHDKMLDATLHHEPARKAVIVISDGDDNQSHAFVEDAIKECQRAETTVYAISTNVSPSRDRGDDTLQKIADATGGRAYYPQRIEDMPNSFSQIQQELRSQYALSYKPPYLGGTGGFRTLFFFCLHLINLGGSRTGYFAPRQAGGSPGQ